MTTTTATSGTVTRSFEAFRSVTQCACEGFFPRSLSLLTAWSRMPRHYYVWKIPEFLKGRVVLRIRYNITTRDFDYGSLANPVEEGAQRTGLRLGPVICRFLACSRHLTKTHLSSSEFIRMGCFQCMVD